METIEELKKKIKLCNIITISAIILIIVCMLISYLISKFMTDRSLAFTIVRGITGVLMFLPVVAMIPLFFRVNLKNKLIMKMKEQDHS